MKTFAVRDEAKKSIEVKFKIKQKATMSSNSKDKPPKCDIPKSKTTCQREACRIQDCLAANGYQREKCEDYVTKLYQCCMQVYDSSKRIPVNCPDPENNPLVQQKNLQQGRIQKEWKTIKPRRPRPSQ